ncbi:MAG: hypothetical protein ACLVJD_05615 [Dorea sp.]
MEDAEKKKSGCKSGVLYIIIFRWRMFLQYMGNKSVLWNAISYVSFAPWKLWNGIFRRADERKKEKMYLYK